MSPDATLLKCRPSLLEHLQLYSDVMKLAKIHVRRMRILTLKIRGMQIERHAFYQSERNVLV